jgi:invasion protein IalB
MKHILFGIVGIAGAAAAQVGTFPASIPAPTQQSAAPVGSAKLICKQWTKLGSRLQQQKLCLTKNEWDDQKRLAHDDVDRRLRVPHIEGGGG